MCLYIVVSYVHLLYCLYVIYITVGAGYLSKVMIIHVDCRILIMHSLIFFLPAHKRKNQCSGYMRLAGCMELS